MPAARKKILIIDDHRETRELISKMLTNEEWRVITAPGGREGIQVARLQLPDIILLDMEMPHLDGIQTCKAMKRIPRVKKIPIIFLTANKDVESVKEAMKAGGSDYIIKPFDPDQLMNRVHKVLSSMDFDPSSVIRQDDFE